MVWLPALNLRTMAPETGRGMVLADNDESGAGERVAKATGLPYWISDRVGEVANNAHARLGLFRLATSLRQALMCKPREAGVT